MPRPTSFTQSASPKAISSSETRPPKYWPAAPDSSAQAADARATRAEIPTCYKALPSVRCQAVGVRKQFDNGIRKQLDNGVRGQLDNGVRYLDVRVREQLNNGVRYLDVRVSCSPDSDDLTLVHAAFPVSLTGSKYLHDLLAECYAFLDENPREVFIIQVLRIRTDLWTLCTDLPCTDPCLALDSDLSRPREGSGSRYLHLSIWHLGALVTPLCHRQRPTNNDGRGFAIDGEHWPDNCDDGTAGSGLIRVQDFCEIDQSTNIEKKTELARAQLELACKQRGHYHVPAAGPRRSPLR
ncbi:hypothetical protein RB595_005093 [Gaeumannomyces hyphopodioides]